VLAGKGMDPRKRLDLQKIKLNLSRRLALLEETSEPVDEDLAFTKEQDDRVLSFREDSKDKVDEEDTQFVFIDSSIRDKELFPEASRYIVRLEKEIDNIIEVSLVQASFGLPNNVKDSARVLRFRFNSVNYDVLIHSGCYRASELAVELNRTMNEAVFAAFIPVTYVIQASTGYIVDSVSGSVPAGIPQVKVSYMVHTKRFVFQVQDQTAAPLAAPELALRFSAIEKNDLLYKNGGFRTYLMAAVFDPVTSTYVLSNAVASAFSPLFTIDQRKSYSIIGVDPVVLRGSSVLILDVPPFNSDNVQGLRFPAFSSVPIKPPFTGDGLVEVNTASYPVKSYFRNGLSRVRQIEVSVREVDGSLADLEGDHFFSLKIVTKKTQAMKPVFAR